MSDSKLQKHHFDSAKQLKLKELKYDSNPCVRRRLSQLFYNQLVSVLSRMESFDGVLLMIIRRKETNGFGEKSVLAL